MSESHTEMAHEMAAGLELRSDIDVLTLLLDGQKNALAAVSAALPGLVRASELVASALRSGKKVIYCGAGSSGLIALLDALELPGTFGLEADQVGICLAGGTINLSHLDSTLEDNSEAGRADIAASGIGTGDCLLAVSASGLTPYTLAALQEAHRHGAISIAVCCNAHAPLLAAAECPILLETPPEVLAGSTRLGAGTAQKAALNLISTLAAMRLGYSFDGQMVNLRIDNGKLRRRATAVVATLGNCTIVAAETFLVLAADSIGVAILMARGAANAEIANKVLGSANHDLRLALGMIDSAIELQR